MGRAARAGLAILFYLTLATPMRSGPSPMPSQEPAVARFRAEPVPLDPGAPGRTRLGPLRYLGGWALRSDDPRLGGISAMHVADGGVTALSDTGLLLSFAVTGGGGDRLAIVPLRDGPGPPLPKSNRDTEAMAVDGGHAWIAFENSNEVWRYRLSDWRAVAHAAPAAMRGWNSNRGTEAMIRFPDGRFLLISEGLEPDWTSQALLFLGDPSEPGTPSVALRYRAPQGYRVTDAALLPDGRLLLLNRTMSGFLTFSAKLAVAELPDGPGTIEPREIATIEAPLTSDNLEALSVTVEDGRTIIWLASDDNYILWQRNLLLKFELVE